MPQPAEVPELHTARFRDVHEDLKVHYSTSALAYIPVRTSVGTPRFIPGARDWPYASLLAPHGLRAIKDWDEFTAGYFARLDKIGLLEVALQLSRIPAQGDARPLLLLCYEDLTTERCHRRLFADWWLGQTGRAVPETPPSTFTSGIVPGTRVLPPSGMGA